MKSVKLLFMAVFMLISAAFANAQGLKASFFSTKFNKEKVWDAQCTPIIPVEKQGMTISGLKDALDINKIAIDWSKGRYLMFVAEADNYNTINSLVDDINNPTTKYNVSLKLFESNGTLVKVISKWGNIIGIGTKSFIYEAEGKSKIFFTIFDKKPTDVIKEKTIVVAKAIKLSQLPITKTKDLVGTVKVYQPHKSFTLITLLENGSTVFASTSAYVNEAREGTIVVFDLIEEARTGTVMGMYVKVP